MEEFEAVLVRVFLSNRSEPFELFNTVGTSKARSSRISQPLEMVVPIAIMVCSSLFQSTPGIAAGRNYALRHAAADVQQVSIHSRQSCRENPHSQRRFRAAQHVSIRSRQCSRENIEREVHAVLPAVVSIHSRQCCRENPNSTAMLADASMFQSTPGSAAGRIR